MKRRILNVEILSVKMNKLLETLDEGVIVTPNVDHLIMLQNDKEFYELQSETAKNNFNGYFGEKEFFTGGLTVSATMDLKLQSDAAQALRKGLEDYDQHRNFYDENKPQVEEKTEDKPASKRGALPKGFESKE
mgnify:CR=1 FL=1